VTVSVGVGHMGRSSVGWSAKLGVGNRRSVARSALAPAQRVASSNVRLDHVRHILLTWNPGPDDDEQWSPEEWQIKMVEGTSEGRTYESDWSVGNRVQGIDAGDRAYMLRQGTHGRGVVAVGKITSAPFTDASWREDGRTAQYVYVTWIEAVPLNQRVDIEDLKAAIPEFEWGKVYSSGRDITEYGSELEELWLGQVDVSGQLPPVVQGAGFGTAEQNRKVEQAAIEHVTAAFKADGYHVKSVESARCGWDLTVTHGTKELHVEVKGVASSIVRFFLTANEHKTALADPHWLLVVVTDALGEPGWRELDGATLDSFAEPALFQVRVPDSAFEG